MSITTRDESHMKSEKTACRRGDRSAKLGYTPGFRVIVIINRDFSRLEIRLHCQELKTKIVRLIILAALSGAPILSRAQEATDAGLQSTPSGQEPRATATPDPSVPELSQIDEIFKQTSLGKEADEMRLRTQWRELANRVANDPGIVAAKKAARAARTDLEKRERLRDYYDVYYGKMRAMASSDKLKAYLDRIKKEHLDLLSQARVRPSVDVTPTPFPSHKKHGKK